MQILNQQQVENRKDEIVAAIRDGLIFIYPTDTIYGLGCNALRSDSVQRLREIKQRDTKPFSVIAPNKDWILEHCDAKREDIDSYLPGPYTLFVKRNDSAVVQEVNPNDETLGVRIPDHWFSEIMKEAGVPFVTTSVNIAGEPNMSSLNDLKETISAQVDYCIFEGEKSGPSSTKIDFVIR